MPRPLLAIAFALAVQLACREPYPYDRRDLVGDRIVAVEASASEGRIYPRAWLLHDGRAWSDEPAWLGWYLLPAAGADDALAAIDPLVPPDAEGHAPSIDLPDTPTALGVVAAFPSGTVARALLRLPHERPRVLPIAGLTLEALPWTTDPEQAPSLDLTNRRETEAEPTDELTRGGWGRLSLVFDPAFPQEAIDELRTRWMTSDGQVVELDRHVTDWAAARITVDDDEITEAEALAPGLVTGLALTQDLEGSNHALPFEIPVDLDTRTLRIHARLLPTDTTFPDSTRWVTGRLVAADDSPAGLRLTDAAPADADTPIRQLPCQGSPALFHPDLLFTGACARADLVGESVLIDRAGPPRDRP